MALPHRSPNWDHQRTNGGGWQPNWWVILTLVIVAGAIFSMQKDGSLVATFNNSTFDDDVVDYLNVSREYSLFIYEDVNPTLENLDVVSSKRIEDVHIVHQSFQEDIRVLKPPKHFETYDKLLIKSVVQTDRILEEAIEAKFGNPDAYNLLVERLNSTIMELHGELKKALTNREIPFEEKANGLIEYHVRVSNSGKSTIESWDNNRFQERWEQIQGEKE